MSIIHDALKKVQQNDPQRSPSSNPVPAPVSPSSPLQVQEKLNIPLLVAALCAVIAMIFAVLPQLAARKTVPAPVAPVTQEQPLLEPAASPAPAVEAPAPAAEISAQPAKPTADHDDPLRGIHVEGVLDMGGKRAALINGNVYEEGQVIYGKLISEITFDAVTVFDNGRKRIIPIKP